MVRVLEKGIDLVVIKYKFLDSLLFINIINIINNYNEITVKTFILAMNLIKYIHFTFLVYQEEAKIIPQLYILSPSFITIHLNICSSMNYCSNYSIIQKL